MTGEVDRAELRREEIARVFTNHRPLGTALARATLTEEEYQKARLFVITHAYGVARTSAFEHRERLKEAAGLIPGFGAFRQWCLEDIKAAGLEDREKGTRQAKNRRLAWLHLFKPFARLHKIGEALEIRALDRRPLWRGGVGCGLTCLGAPSCPPRRSFVASDARRRGQLYTSQPARSPLINRGKLFRQTGPLLATQFLFKELAVLMSAISCDGKWPDESLIVGVSQ